MMRWKIKYLRFRIKRNGYYLDRLNKLMTYKEMLDKRFWIFESGGIVGDRIWDLHGGEYLDYCRRVRPILKNRIAWYKKKSDKKFEV